VGDEHIRITVFLAAVLLILATVLIVRQPGIPA
jgi:hypothetical protein